MSEATKYSAASREGKTLLALRAGPMTNGELYERFPSGHLVSALVKAGLAESCDDGWRLTDAGRAACPLRNPAAATITPPVVAPLKRSPAPVGLPAKTAPQPHVSRPETPVFIGGPRMPNRLRGKNPSAVNQLRRLLADAPDGLARRDIITRTGLSENVVDNAIYNLIKVGDAVRLRYGVIAAASGLDAAQIAARLERRAGPVAVDPATQRAAAIDFALYDDGRLAISDGDELFVLQPDATRRLGQFLGRIEINGWPASL